MKTSRLRPTELAFWEEYASTTRDPEGLAHADVRASVAGDERNADALLRLYLDGKKSAGSSLKRAFAAGGEPLPKVGEFWMILDSRQRPRCIVKTVRVETHRFRDVPEAVAIAEGEGDLSLAFWRKEHIDFFAPYLKQLGINDLENEEIITEFFEVVYPPTPRRP
jgi:uncharacterized protein YhfF